MKPVFVALTTEGFETARRAAAIVGGEVHAAPPLPADRPVEKIASHLRDLFNANTPIVGVCAAGILIRVLAPLLAGKRVDPPVLAMSEEGDSIVPLLGGHSGANELARRIAEGLGTHAAITTTGDNRFGVTLDVPPEGWTLANPQDAKSVMAALLGGATARLEGRADWLEQSRIAFSPDGDIRFVATTQAIRPSVGDEHQSPPPSRGRVTLSLAKGAGEGEPAATSRGRPVSRPSADAEGHPLPQGERALALIYHPRRLAVGLGCERGASPQEAIALMQETLAAAGLAPASVALIASLDLKADEPAVLAAAEHLGVPARFFTATALEAETPRLQNPSDTVFREVGCHGVAEGAALAATGPAARLVVAKRKSTRATCAIAEAPDVIEPAKVGRARGRLAIVGIGPGAPDWLTPESRISWKPAIPSSPIRFI